MATLADLPLGATILIPVGTDENRLCEIADKDNLVSSGTVLVYKKIYEFLNICTGWSKSMVTQV